MGDLEVDIKEIKEYNPDEDGYIHIDSWTKWIH